MVKYDVANTPIVDLVNNIILVAVKSRASDIHFDPLENGLKIRMRIDGNLQDHTILPKDSERNVTTRIKLISGMNITENRLPQDGAIKGRIDNLDLDMRVSVLPTNEGEKVVIRILDYSMSLEGLNRLDFSPTNYEKVVRMTQVPNGIILVTGATGSGKSTTTYAMLQTLNKEETNIITVEDPIEMNIEGINQVQVNSEIGMTFAAALRSILRQDPNVILIGEIRDSETARIAVRASITGHVVLSTVHTNDSLSTIERLIDMDVERYLLSTALEGIISQKLARRLCPHCKKTRPATAYEKMVFKDIMKININEMWEPAKCDHCSNGFWGRIAIQEVLTVNDEIRDIINKTDSDKEELRKIVYEKNDTITLLQDGLDKVAKGFTTFEEIYKLIEIDEALMLIHQAEENDEQENQEQSEVEKTETEAPTETEEQNTITITEAPVTTVIETPITMENTNIELQPAQEITSIQVDAPTLTPPPTLPIETPTPEVTQTPTIDLQPAKSIEIQTPVENQPIELGQTQSMEPIPVPIENVHLETQLTPPTQSAPTTESIENTPSEVVQEPPINIEPAPVVNETIVETPITTENTNIELPPVQTTEPIQETEKPTPETIETPTNVENPTQELSTATNLEIPTLESTQTTQTTNENKEEKIETTPSIEMPTIQITEPPTNTSETKNTVLENSISNDDSLI